jgi:hypothetical protein
MKNKWTVLLVLYCAGLLLLAVLPITVHSYDKVAHTLEFFFLGVLALKAL